MERALLLLKKNIYKCRAGEGFPSPIPVLSDHVVANTPEAVYNLTLVLRSSTIDFVHKIGTRPPQLSLRGYLCVHMTLRPGRLRSILSDYIVESLSMKPLPVTYRLLAMRRAETRHCWDLKRRRPHAPHPTRSGIVYLGTHFSNTSRLLAL